MEISSSLSKEERIRMAAEKVFSLYGYEKATLDEIIALADVGKGTVYKYFGNKEKLFYKLVYDKNKPFVEDLRNAVAKETDLEKKLLSYFKVMVDFYYENAPLWQIIFFEMLSGGNGCIVQYVDDEPVVLPRYSVNVISEEVKDLTIRYHRLVMEEVNILKGILQEGMDKGQLKQSNLDISCKYLFFGVAMSLFNPYRPIRERLASEEIASIIVDRFLHGEQVK